MIVDACEEEGDKILPLDTCVLSCSETRKTNPPPKQGCYRGVIAPCAGTQGGAILHAGKVIQINGTESLAGKPELNHDDGTL